MPTTKAGTKNLILRSGMFQVTIKLLIFLGLENSKKQGSKLIN